MSVMADIVPNITQNKPNAKQIIFLYTIQLNRPYPVSQSVTSSMQTFEKLIKNALFEVFFFQLDIFSIVQSKSTYGK